MITQKELKEIKYLQNNQLVVIVNMLSKLVKSDIIHVKEFLQEPDNLFMIRNTLSTVRNDAAKHRNKFAQLDHQMLVGLYEKEMGILGDFLVVFGKRSFEEADLKIIHTLDIQLLDITIKILDALVSFNIKPT